MRIGGTDLTNISQTYVLDTCKRAKGNVEMVEYKSGKFAFQGKALVDWMLKEGTVLTQEEAMKLANLFVACKLITKVVSDKGPMQAFSLSCLYVLTIKPSEGDKAKANSALGVLRLEYGCARHLRISMVRGGTLQTCLHFAGGAYASLPSGIHPSRATSTTPIHSRTRWCTDRFQASPLS